MDEPPILAFDRAGVVQGVQVPAGTGEAEVCSVDAGDAVRAARSAQSGHWIDVVSAGDWAGRTPPRELHEVVSWRAFFAPES